MSARVCQQFDEIWLPAVGPNSGRRITEEMRKCQSYGRKARREGDQVNEPAPYFPFGDTYRVLL